MQITKIYSSNDGNSHFVDKEVELSKVSPFGTLSEPIKTENLIFRKTEGDYFYDWHTAPKKQFIVMLGDVEIHTSDGEKRIFTCGDVLLVEDTFGKGHLSKSVNGKPRNSLFISLE